GIAGAIRRLLLLLWMLALLWCARARSVRHASCSLMSLLTLLTLLAPGERLLPASRCGIAPILGVWTRAIVSVVCRNRRLLAGRSRCHVWPEEAAWRWPACGGSRIGRSLASGLRAGLLWRLNLCARLLRITRRVVMRGLWQCGLSDGLGARR